jgi:hypothetical protein
MIFCNAISAWEGSTEESLRGQGSLEIGDPMVEFIDELLAFGQLFGQMAAVVVEFFC